MSSKWAGGGLLTTAPDLVRFGSALISPTRGYLTPATIDLLFDPVKPRLLGFGYALGWMAARDPRLRRVRFHFGAGSGGTAVLAVYPEQRIAVAVLANLGHAGFTPGRLFGIVNAFAADPVWRALGLDRRRSPRGVRHSRAH
jgi:CubicO group peptidase (beta-lactamase class C family)